MPPSQIKLAVARHGARADDDPLWAHSDPLARLWDPPLSSKGKEQASSLGDFAVSLGVTRLVVSPFTRCLQTAAAVAKKILEKKEVGRDEAKEKKATEANGSTGASSSFSLPRPPPPPLVIEIDASVCEVLSRDCMGGQDPPGGPDPSLWAWREGRGGEGGGEEEEEEEEENLERRLLSAAEAAGLPSELTSLVSSSRFALYPETKSEAGTRYLIALAGVAARTLVGAREMGEEVDEKTSEENPRKEKKASESATPPPATTAATTMVVTHGEAVVAATRMTGNASGEPYAVPPTGVVVLDVLLEEDENENDKDEETQDGDESSAAAAAVACARWELAETARGVAFE